MKKYWIELKEGEALFCDYCEKIHGGPTWLYVIISKDSIRVNGVTCFMS